MSDRGICCMGKYLPSFLRKIYALAVQRIEYSAVSRLLDKMSDESTCKTDQIKMDSPNTTAENDSLKRPLQDESTTEDPANKRMKTELGEKVYKAIRL